MIVDPTKRRGLLARNSSPRANVLEDQLAGAEIAPFYFALSPFYSVLFRSIPFYSVLFAGPVGLEPPARAHQQATADADAVRSNGRREAEAILERARADIEAERERALQELRAQVSALVVDAAAKVLGQAIDAKAHQRLIEESLASVGSRS